MLGGFRSLLYEQHEGDWGLLNAPFLFQPKVLARAQTVDTFGDYLISTTLVVYDNIVGAPQDRPVS